MTASFFGFNINPTDVQEVIYSIPRLSEISNSFAIKTNENKDGDK